MELSSSSRLKGNTSIAGVVDEKGIAARYLTLQLQQKNNDHTIRIENPSTSSKYICHRDGLGRRQKLPVTQRQYFLRPKDGRLVELVVQKSDSLISPSPPLLRAIRWIYAGTLDVDPWQDQRNQIDETREETRKLRWIPGSLLVFVLLFWPQSMEGSIRNGGWYDPVRYREWRYCKISRNVFEDRGFQTSTGSGKTGEEEPLVRDGSQRPDASGAISVSESKSDADSDARAQSQDKMADALDVTRELGPKLLCFLEEGPGGVSYRTMKVQSWIAHTGTEGDPDYVFVSYTRKQFCVATPQELDGWSISEQERHNLKLLSQVDRSKLCNYGIAAARRAKVPAFWVDFECLAPNIEAGESSHRMSDVYRICDIVQAAHSMVIIRGAPWDTTGHKSDIVSTANKSSWLRQWGDRLWTVPEALLCPSRYIDVYTDGEDWTPEAVPKRRLPARAWRDADDMRQLIEHYASSIHLTPLELVSIALEALQWRQTDMNTSGDVSYALMGLVRRRPAVSLTDSDFEAFARLSLANDSDKLLERLLCMQPLRHDAPWHEIKDAWGVKLWDIEPHCQLAGIVDNRTVTLDGAHAATICWHKVPQVAFFKRPTLGRLICVVLIRLIPGYLVVAIFLLIIGGSTSSNCGTPVRRVQCPMSGLTIAGIIVFILTILSSLYAPAALVSLYRGKFWSTQASFIGMHGIPDLGLVEQYVFGINCGRLQWSAIGGLLSRHESHDGERRPMPPTATEVKPLEIYTIIDTFAMTATAFHAERPPSVVMICGREGGMQRAVLCSYDWQTQTFCREAVLRFKTIILERMSRIERVRFCLSRNGREAVC